MQATSGLERDRRQDQFPTRYTEQDEFPTACSLPTTIYIANPGNIGEVDQPVVIEKPSTKVELRTCGLRKRTAVRFTVFILGLLVVMGVVLAAYLGSKVALMDDRSGSELKRCVCVHITIRMLLGRDEGWETKMKMSPYRSSIVHVPPGISEETINF